MKCHKCHTDNPDTSRFCGGCAAPLGDVVGPGFSATRSVERAAQAPSPGTIIAGKYRIIEEIGQGGMGVVYRAEDIKLNRPVALKFLPSQWTSEQEARVRFIREARAASALDHPNICNVHEIGETEDGRMFIAMACYEGESLREKIRRGPLKPEEAIGIAIQIAQGMGMANDKGIVHRDIKPANILITNEGVAKIVDFGLAKLAGQVRLTREGSTVGTVAYMSPEQVKGEAVDQRTDIWSIGIVLYEMVSGHLPFKGDLEQSLAHSILTSEPEPLSKLQKDLPKGLKQVIFKSLVKNPSARYQSMGELVEDLKAIAEGLKPIRAKLGLFRGRIFGIKKAYAYSGLACLAVLAGVWQLSRVQAYDSIAVLPIVYSSGDADQEAFCDGVHQELINRLSSIRAFNKVIAKNTMMVFKGTKKKSSEIAKELKVSVIVSVSASRSGSKIRIGFEVIDGKSDQQISGENFDGEYTNILDLESAAAMTIARSIQVSLTPGETASLTRKRPVNPEAYELHLKGFRIMDSLDEGEFRKALDYFQRAVDLDPTYAAGYASIASFYIECGFRGDQPLKETIPRARAALGRALELDDELAETHIGLGALMFYNDWDWSGAERELLRGLALDPNRSVSHSVYGTYLTITRRYEAAVAEIRRAVELDPLSATQHIYLAQALLYARRYDDSIAQLNLTLDANPALAPQVHMLIGWNYAQKNMYNEAVIACDKAVQNATEDQQVLSVCGHIYGITGKHQQAAALLDRLQHLSERHYVDPYYIALVYDGLGDSDRAMERLEQSYTERSPSACFVGAESWTDRLRADPRFQDLVRRMKYPLSSNL